MFFSNKNKTVDFDKEKWLQNREERIFMVTSLINKKLIDNLFKEEVREILGFEFNDLYSNVWSYYLGKKNNIFSKKSHLYVYFDTFGKAYKILIK